MKHAVRHIDFAASGSEPTKGVAAARGAAR